MSPTTAILAAPRSSIRERLLLAQCGSRGSDPARPGSGHASAYGVLYRSTRYILRRVAARLLRTSHELFVDRYFGIGGTGR